MVENNSNPAGGGVDGVYAALSNWFNQYQAPDVYGGFDWAQLENNAGASRARYAAYQADRKIRKPYVDAGHQGLTALNDFSSGRVPLDQIPTFRATMDEQLGTLRKFQASRGRLLGSRAAKEMVRTAGRVTSDQWQREWSRRYKEAYSGSPYGYSPNYVGSPTAMGLDQFSKKYAGFGGNGNRAPLSSGGGSSAPAEQPNQVLISDKGGYAPKPSGDISPVETDAERYRRRMKEIAWQKKHPNRAMPTDFRGN